MSKQLKQKQFFQRLSTNFIELLDDDEFYDVTIEVGKDSNMKIFRAHMAILCYRSPFLKKNLRKSYSCGVLTNVKLSNMPPETFHIILK